MKMTMVNSGLKGLQLKVKVKSDIKVQSDICLLFPVASYYIRNHLLICTVAVTCFHGDKKMLR